MGVKAVSIDGKWYVRVNYRRRRVQHIVSPNTQERAHQVADKVRIGLDIYGANPEALFLDGQPPKTIVSPVPEKLVGIHARLAEYQIPQVGPCIYFLCLGDEVVYIGQTMNLPTRISHHCENPLKRFNRVFFFTVKEAELNALESRLIAQFQPPLNKVGKTAIVANLAHWPDSEN